MGACGTIAEDLGQNCAEPLQAGTEDVMIVINRIDWLGAAFTVDPGNNQIITGITLPVSKTGFKYTGKNNSNTPKQELIKTQFSKNYNHEINFKVFQVDATAKKELEALDDGEYVVLVENKYKGVNGASAFEIYGGNAGVITSQNLREPNNVELGGAFDVILKSNELSLEPHLPKTLFDTDYATTKAIFDSLLV